MRCICICCNAIPHQRPYQGFLTTYLLPSHNYRSPLQSLFLNSLGTLLKHTSRENRLQHKFSSCSRSSTSNKRVNIFHRRRKIELSNKSRPIRKTELNRCLRERRVDIGSRLSRFLCGCRCSRNRSRSSHARISRNRTTINTVLRSNCILLGGRGEGYLPRRFPCPINAPP
jgi:hypothetical protein